MEANKILSADLLDLLFDGRNKDYGAYELRKTYNKRILKAFIITVSVALLALAGSLTAKAFNRKNNKPKGSTVTIMNIADDPKKPEVPTPLKPVTPPRLKTIIYTPPRIVDDNKADKVIEENKNLDSAKISVIAQDGINDIGLATPNQIDEGKQVIETKKDNGDDNGFSPVEVEAQFPGGDAAWVKYLERNLRSDVATENGAPAGDYTVIVQFIVDKEGNVSDVTALTNHGYGMEQEAVRVIKKGPQWKPALQNGSNVKAYRKQPITFRIQDNQ